MCCCGDDEAEGEGGGPSSVVDRVTLFNSRLCRERERERGQRSEVGDAHQEVVSKGLVGPGVVEGRGQIHVPIQNYQQRPTETAERT